jgi:HEAT repeat protein
MMPMHQLPQQPDRPMPTNTQLDPPKAIAVPIPMPFSRAELPQPGDSAQPGLARSFAWAVLLAIAWLGLVSVLPAAEPSAKERDLVAVLTSDAGEAEKAITCKQLAIYGSAHSVEALERLLPNERLASWARIALEAIPGPEASAALRRSTAVLRGRELIGVINTLGVRADADAVPLLLTRLSGSDDDVAEAAAAALGRIGGAAAVAGLESHLISDNENRRNAVAEACVVAGEALLDAGNASEAAALAAAVRKAEISEQREAEALRLAIRAGGSEGMALLTGSFWEPSQRLFAMAVITARSMPTGDDGSSVDAALTAGIEGLLAGKGPDNRAAILLDVVGQRGSSSALPLVLRLAADSPQSVRLAAIDAAGRLGDASVLEPLLVAVGDDDAEISAAARAAVTGLSGDAIDAALIEKLKSDNQAELIAVVEAIGTRRLNAGNQLVPLVAHADESVRVAVLRSLGSVADLDSMEVIITRVREPSSEAEGEAAKLALLEAAVRMPDRDRCAERIAAALADAKEAAAADIVLLETLAAVGGSKALATVQTAASSGASELEDASTRLLGTWMTADAAPVLLELASSDNAFRGRALRGYLRIARQFTMPDDQRADMCRAALKAAANDDERKLVVEILPRNPSQAMLTVAREAAAMPGLAESAKAAAAAIEEKLAAKAG